MTGPSSPDRAPSGAYAALERRFARLHQLGEASSLLGWDRQVMMPPGAAEARGETLSALAGLSHEMLVDDRVGDWLEAADDELTGAEPDPWRSANLREMRRRRLHATAVSSDLVEALALAENRGDMAWRKARADDDFAGFLPALDEMLKLQRALGQALGEALERPAYDALMDRFEPAADSASITAMFDELAAFLPDFLDAVLARQEPPPAPQGPFPIDAQRALGERLMGAVGFDFERGRLDVSLHPFCGGGDDDIRITTRYDEADYASALMGVLHETGHALYEQGRPPAWRAQPVGAARGMALHESQSLLLEMQVCRGPEFIGYAAPMIRDAFGADGSAAEWSDAALRRRAIQVRRGLIRVDADEVSYPLHVILRFRLEQAMLDGSLPAADLPEAWRDGMRSLLGVAPATDAEGCLQDIHWADGAWGYFPSYTLGALAAAQLFQAAVAAEPDIPQRIAKGDFAPLLGWLRANVHGKASLLSSDGLIREATGAPLSTQAFLAHLRRRYTA